MVKNPPTNAGDEVQSLDQKDPLEEEMATHSSILAWEIPWTEEPRGLHSMGVAKRVGHDLALSNNKTTNTEFIRIILYCLKETRYFI